MNKDFDREEIINSLKSGDVQPADSQTKGDVRRKQTRMSPSFLRRSGLKEAIGSQTQ